MMDKNEKEEIKLKLLFILCVLMFLFVMVMAFRVVKANNEMTVWMLEHGRLK